MEEINWDDVLAIMQGIADGEAGREQTLEEYVAQIRAERAARQKTKLLKTPRIGVRLDDLTIHEMTDESHKHKE